MNKTNKNGRINEEHVCADALVYFLKNTLACHQVTIQQEANDPPDFWITINGEKFPAEVTSIVKDEDYRAQCRRLKDDIKEGAAKQGVLAGKYELEIMRHPKIPGRNSSRYRDLINYTISFIQNTRNVCSTDKILLIQNRRNSLSIEKLSNGNATVGLEGPIEVKWGGEIREELRDLMQNAIEKKRQRLEPVKNMGHQIMLLLYDAYAFCDTEDAQAALLNVKGYDWFHSIFWAASFTNRKNEEFPQSPGRDGKFLYSREQRWWKNPLAD